MLALYLLLMAYGILLLWLAAGFLHLPKFEQISTEARLPVSIIICARNEERYIARCLISILAQDYDKKLIQVIVVDDASDDTTFLVAKELLSHSGIDYLLMQNKTQKGKKLSLNAAIQEAKHNVIISRDADTFTKSEYWLLSLANYYLLHSTDMLIAPIAMADNSGGLWALQAVENNVLNLIAGGSAYYHKAFLCSGANLMFTKTAFASVNGYTSHLHIASGDDVLFLKDLKQIEGSKIAFIKSRDALVYTYAVRSLKELFKQKIRWASKIKSKSSKPQYNFLNLFLSIFTFSVNLAWLYCFIHYFLVVDNFSLCFLLLKLGIDLFLLLLSGQLVRNRNLGWYALAVGLVYPVYAVLVAISSLVVKPKWK